MPTACGEQEAVIASAYFPGDSNDAPPREQNVNYSNFPIRSIEELEYEATDVHNNIENAFKKSYIHKNRKSRRDVPWWNKTLEKKRKDGYADDLVICVSGCHEPTISERMQNALDTTTRWCESRGLTINLP
ncbi:hypothetical protein ACLKA7_005585 [Drosophila subpalustris]